MMLGRFIYHIEGTKKSDSAVRKFYASVANAADGKRKGWKSRNLGNGGPAKCTALVFFLITAGGFAALFIPAAILRDANPIWGLHSYLFALSIVWLAMRLFQLVHWIAARKFWRLCADAYGEDNEAGYRFFWFKMTVWGMDAALMVWLSSYLSGVRIVFSMMTHSAMGRIVGCIFGLPCFVLGPLIIVAKLSSDMHLHKKVRPVLS